MPAPPQSVIILGGGTAGWMTANLLRRRWSDQGTKVSLIESKDIGIIGVGEGSTPQLKAFFDEIGVSEAEWMPRCNATYKAGIEFAGWSDKPGFERYFHPFPTDVDGFTQGQFFYSTRARRTGRDVPAHPDPFFLPTRIAREGLAPVAPSNFPFFVSYGYHFDAHLIGAFLRDLGTGRGIEHVDARIASVELDEHGNVAALVADDGRHFEADFFVDASGFRAAIIEAALKEAHRPFAENLFNDRAVVAPTPHQTGPLHACTRSTAKSAGWIWHIPLTNRIGNGYVYSSRYIDPDEAAAELRAHLGLAEDAEVRQLQMKCGRIERSWVKNCLAVGLAQGFLEPLEATALHVVLATVNSFLDAWENDQRDAFNERIAARYEGIRDYLVCHYRTAQRRDTEYWRDATSHDELSESLKGVITAWFTGADLEQEVMRQQIGGYYSPASWHCMLAGYGNFPNDTKLKPPGPDVARIDMAEVERFVAGCAMNFPNHANALEHLTEVA
ncbi:MAG TPA: tryptophan halogenase family protein [Sphingomicrobium sp.]|jgi:2-polyprenyl-6-methoxyphenol hydroxylase-like FAD-dependent oxidoreductase